MNIMIILGLMFLTVLTGCQSEGDGQTSSDTSSPTVTSLRVTSNSPTSVTITFFTNVEASSEIKYADGSYYAANGIYNQVEQTSGYFTSHSVTLNNLLPSTTYHYQIGVTDSASNTTTSDNHNFTTLVQETETTGPVISNPTPSQGAVLPVGTTSTALAVTTDVTAECRYATSANTVFETMTGIFSTTGLNAHSTTLTSLSDGNVYTYYVRCQDSYGNSNTADYPIVFSVALAQGDSNHPPVLDNIANITVIEEETVTFNPSASDADNDMLSYSYSGWMTSNSYTTQVGDAGTYTVTVTVSDGQGGTDSQDVTVTVVEATVVAACTAEAVTSDCSCGGQVVSSGYCCDSTPQSAPCVSSCAGGTVYYVSNDGNDNLNTGLSDQDPWETIAKVNATSLGACDQVLFEKGGVWRDTLVVSSDGAPDGYITYSSYGSGENPRILGSDTSTEWTATGTSNVWQSTSTFSENPHRPNYQYSDVWFELNSGGVVWGEYKQFDASFTALTQAFDWTYDSGIVYVYAEQSPQNLYRSVEISQRHNCIVLNNKSNIEVNGIDLHYAALSGIRDSYPTSSITGLTVRNCNIGYFGVKNDSAAFGIYTWRNDLLVENNEIHDAGRRGISYFGTSAGNSVTFGNAVIQDNLFYNGWHTTALDVIVESGSDHNIDGVIFRRNIIKEDPSIMRDGSSVPNSNHIFVADQSGAGSGTIRNIYIYNNVFENAPGSAIKTEDIVNLNVANNTFYKFNPYLSNFQSFVNVTGSLEAGASANIINNIFYHNGVFAFNNNLQCIKLTPDIQGVSIINYNLHYTEDEDARIFTLYPPQQSWTVPMWDAYVSTLGYEAESPRPANPAFVGEPDDLRISDQSDAKNAGTPIPWVTTDILGNVRDEMTPSLGAYE